MMDQEIEKTLKTYLQAIYQRDYEKMYELLDKEDTLEYQSMITDFAEKMDVFGETEDFLQHLNIQDLAALKRMPNKEFLFSIFKKTFHEIAEKEIQRMIKGTEILSIDHADLLAIVKYEFPVKMFDSWEKLQGDVNMIFKENKWQIFFKSGFQFALQSFQKEIDFYYDQKKKDQLSNLQDEGDLTPFTIVGYKNIEGDVVFEPRFKDAGSFSDGLAYVKIMRKYGYINLKGDIAIKPQFEEAHTFSEGRAGVYIYVQEKGRLWGFINKRGKLIIPAIYDEISSFCEGLCAVETDGKWGFIDKKGQTVIPFKFEEVDDFYQGEANVQLLNAEEEWIEMTIDKEGKLVD